MQNNYSSKAFKLLRSPYFFLLVLATINLLVAFFFVRYPLQLNGDSPSYLAAMKLMQGQEYDQALYGADTEKFVRSRILTTPLTLYSTIFVSKFFGDEYSALLYLNLVFYFLIILVFYNLVKEVYQNKLVAFLGTILFFTNYCLYNYGVTYRTDLGGWFFFILGSWLAVKYYRLPQQEKYYYWSILSAAVGVLFKEYGALSLITLVILLWFFPGK